MQQTNINGYQVTIFTGYHGTQLFIAHPEGYTMYAHKVSGDEASAMERAREVINVDMPAPVETPAPAKDRMICLSDRKAEFKAALKRGLENDLEVYPDFEKDAFVVVNHTNKSEYRVSFETRGGQAFSVCSCKDFEIRRHVCKHISEVLTDTFFGVVESFGVNLQA